MNTFFGIEFDEWRLGQAVISSGMGVMDYYGMKLEIISTAFKAIGCLHLFAADSNRYVIPKIYDQEIFDQLAFTQGLLESQFVEAVHFKWDSFHSQDVDAILEGVALMRLPCSVWSVWHSDRLAEQFTPVPYRLWVDPLLNLLESFHEYTDYHISMPASRWRMAYWLKAPGREVMLSPGLGKNTLSIECTKNWTEYANFIQVMKCLPDYLSLYAPSQK